MGHSVPSPLSSGATAPDDLLVAVGTGDESAFALLYDHLAGAVLGVACDILGEGAIADEVARDVFVELWGTACRYSRDHGGAFEWAMAIAHRHAVERLRSTAAASSANGVPRQFTRAQGVQRNARCGLDALPPLQRESLELAYYRGLTYTEIGVVHHISPETAKALLRDALVNLRDRQLNSGRVNS